MPTQNIPILLRETCCVRLATVLRCVAACWVLLAQVWKFWAHNTQHVATGWPNARNMLRPTMLRYVALAYLRSFGRGLTNNHAFRFEWRNWFLTILFLEHIYVALAKREFWLANTRDTFARGLHADVSLFTCTFSGYFFIECTPF